MKKFGIIAVLALFAFGVSAQEPEHHHNRGNKAILNQAGWMQIGIIDQVGANNKAVINQGWSLCNDDDALQTTNHGPWSFMNMAIIKQIGFYNEGTINQEGHKNFAKLMQINFFHHHGPSATDNSGDHHYQRGPIGEINQTGNHNYAYALQFGISNLLIEQPGNFNYVGGIHHHNNGASIDQTTNGGHHSSPLVIGRREDIKINQYGNGNYFFGVGMLKYGTATITQGNDLHHMDGNFGPQSGNHFFDFNFIYLAQKGGNVVLDQNGKKNFIWLEVEGSHHNNPEVEINQTGWKNKVARYHSPWSHHAYAPAEFEGKCLKIDQWGYGNKLSIEGDDKNGVIIVKQFGFKNFGKIEQRGFHH